MRTRTFGPTEIEVPILGQGTYGLESDPRAAVAVLRAGLDAGLTHIDTAELYGRGRVEEVVGQAIEGRRDDVFLVSKVLPENATRQGTIDACERSLRRLQTDRLDCYLLHWESVNPLEDTIAAFMELEEAGKILSWGVSNFDVPWLQKVRDVVGDGAIACNQVLYHLRERAIEHEVVPWCEEKGVAVVGYSPFGHGSFPGEGSAEGRALADVAARLDATPRQVALAFLTRRPGTFAIPMTSRPTHVRENAGAFDLEIDDEHLARLEDAFPLGASRSGVPTL